MNVEAEPAALAELKQLGVPLVPAVVVGDRAVHGWLPAAYAALLGVPYAEAVKLSPPALATRLDRILAASERVMRAFPDAAMDFKPPERDRTIRDLGFHLFRLALAFPDAMDAGALPEGWLQERAPAGMTAGGAVADYGADVRGRLRRWFAGRQGSEYARMIDVYYGPQSGHDLLERTTWHAAQHLRQLHVLAERAGVMLPDPLPTAAFAGLPLPDALW